MTTTRTKKHSTTGTQDRTARTAMFVEQGINLKTWSLAPFAPLRDGEIKRALLKSVVVPVGSLPVGQRDGRVGTAFLLRCVILAAHTRSLLRDSLVVPLRLTPTGRAYEFEGDAVSWECVARGDGPIN
jgi:hypothetical protein